MATYTTMYFITTMNLSTLASCVLRVLCWTIGLFPWLDYVCWKAMSLSTLGHQKRTKIGCKRTMQRLPISSDRKKKISQADSVSNSHPPSTIVWSTNWGPRRWRTSGRKWKRSADETPVCPSKVISGRSIQPAAEHTFSSWSTGHSEPPSVITVITSQQHWEKLRKSPDCYTRVKHQAQMEFASRFKRKRWHHCYQTHWADVDVRERRLYHTWLH